MEEGRGKEKDWKDLTKEREKREEPENSLTVVKSPSLHSQQTACSASQAMAIPRGPESPWQGSRDPRQAPLPGRHEQTDWHGRDLFHLTPLGQSSHLASHLHLPLEALEEARLVRKAGREQDGRKKKRLGMVGLPPWSINKD